MRIDTVCKGCEERYPACHDYCERYKQARAEFEENKAFVAHEKAKQDEYYYYRKGKRKR